MRRKVESEGRCGLCGKVGPIIKTTCCGHWICDSLTETTKCAKKHWRFTLCGMHEVNKHPGRWQSCDVCRTDYWTEMYVYYGTNKYNFEKLEDPPFYKPTLCGTCGRVIVLSRDGFSHHPDGSFHHDGCDPIE
jgi:hypothetical protein